MRTIAIGALAAVALATALGFLFARDVDTIVAVDAARRFQTMRGWEATARLWETDKVRDRYDASWERFRDLVLDRLVDEVGIDRIRIEAKSGIENPVDYWALFRDGRIGYWQYRQHYYEKINDNADPAVVDPRGFQLSLLDFQVENIVKPLAARLAARGERLFVTLTYVDFASHNQASDVSHAADPAEYAELIDAVFRHLASRHAVVPDALEVILEPENTERWGGPEIGAAIVAVTDRLARSGFAPGVIAPSTTAAAQAPAYFDAFATVPGALAKTTTIGYHRYDGASADAALEAIRARAKRHGLETAMLEYLQGGARELHADLTRADVSAWQQYSIASSPPPRGRDDGGSYFFVDPAQEGPAAVRLGERTYGLAQYFRHVRHGAVRVAAASSSPLHAAVAFVNTNGTHVVVVQSRRSGTITVTGVPEGVYGVFHTTDRERLHPLPDITVAAGRALTVRLPRPGIVTLHQKQQRSQ